ncbi:MAG: hypothetical protein JWR38_3386 [Mucilaginibacter sp.]|nr:hypothetical protein [Mucilaginibacter sp.]
MSIVFFMDKAELTDKIQFWISSAISLILIKALIITLGGTHNNLRLSPVSFWNIRLNTFDIRRGLILRRELKIPAKILLLLPLKI